MAVPSAVSNFGNTANYSRRQAQGGSGKDDALELEWSKGPIFSREIISGFKKALFPRDERPGRIVGRARELRLVAARDCEFCLAAATNLSEAHSLLCNLHSLFRSQYCSNAVAT